MVYLKFCICSSLHPYVCLCEQILSGWYLLDCSTFCNQTGYGGVLSRDGVSCRKICLLSSRSRSQWGLIINYWNMTCSTSTTFFWTADSLAIKLGLMVHHHKPECLVGKKKKIVFKVKVTAKVQNVNEWMSRWYLQSFQHFGIELGMMMNHNEPGCHVKDWLAVFKVKVTGRVGKIKIWQFLLYLLNCWSFYNQTWFDCTIS